MIAESLLLISLVIQLYYYRSLPIILIYVAIYLTIYWLPKCIFVEFLNKWFPSVITHTKVKDKTIYLTFDDAPYGYSRRIMDQLDKWDMKASFFVISDYVTDATRGTMIQAIRDGHQLCNHGQKNSMAALLSYENLDKELGICQEVIDNLYDIAHVRLPKNKFYRPGCGLFNGKILQYMKENNYHLTLGSVYPNDPVFFIPYMNYLYLISHIESGDVIILHDRSWTPKTLEYLLPYLAKNGYKTEILDKLV